jgi:hypothetical protein
VDRRDEPNGSLAEIARQDWESGVVDRCHRIPEVAGWRVLCHKCPRATDWVHVGYRSGQATPLFPIATSWRSFVGCPRGTWVQSLYGDKRTSVVKAALHLSASPVFLISICRLRVIRDRSSQPCVPSDVRFAQKATKLLRGSEMTRRASYGSLGNWVHSPALIRARGCYLL